MDDQELARRKLQGKAQEAIGIVLPPLLEGQPDCLQDMAVAPAHFASQLDFGRALVADDARILGLRQGESVAAPLVVPFQLNENALRRSLEIFSIYPHSAYHDS